MDRPGKFLTKTFWIIPLIFYWYTACRYPGWVDAPMIAWHVDALATGTWVNSHSLFYIIGKFWTWIFPWGDYHFRLNLLCGVLGAITVHFVFLTAVLITENVLAALLGGLALMLSHSLWWHSTMLEVYTLNTALLSIILFLVAKFSITKRLTFLYLSLFFWGLSIVNHVLMGLLIVGFMAFFLLSDERKRLFTFDIIIKSIFFVFCGAQIYIFLFLKDVNIELSRTADFSYPGLWHSFRHVLDQATGGHFKGAMFPTGLTFASQINWKLNYIFLLIINFPSVFFIFGWFGLWKFFRRNPNSTWNIFFIFSLLSQAVWSASYLIWDMYAFALPVWVMFGLASAIGFDYVLKNWPNYRKLCLSLSITLLIGPFLYSAVPTWAQTPGFWKNYFSSFDRMANFWNAAEYFANPNKRNYDRVEVIANNFFSKMPPGAHFFDDDGKGQYPFSYYYQRLLHKRSDIVIHPIFSPQFDDTAAAQYAVQIKKLLERGNSVFISAIVFPERLILNHLYALMAQNSVISATYATGLSRERIIETFPKLAFQKFDLLPDASAYIYKIVLKDSVETRSSAEYLIEGESLSVIKKPAESYLAAQALDDRWSAEGHILSLENIKGAEYLFSIEIPRDLNGKILVRPTKSFDFGQVTFSLNIPDSKGNTIDLYSPNPIPSNEISLLQGKLSKGSYLLRVVIEGSNAEAVPKMGFGIDYLKIVEINSTD